MCMYVSQEGFKLGKLRHNSCKSFCKRWGFPPIAIMHEENREIVEAIMISAFMLHRTAHETPLKFWFALVFVWSVDYEEGGGVNVSFGSWTSKGKMLLTRSTTRRLTRLCRHFSFSYPAPRTLDEVVKLDLLKDESPERINEIWQEYHDSKDDVIGASWTTTDYESFLETGKTASMFVFPVERSDGNFVMLSQVQEQHCILTMLDEYKLNPANAQPWLALTFYDDLAEDKDVVLVRGDVLIPQLTLEEGKRLWGNVRHFYLNETDQVDKFNNDPNEFNIDSHLARNFEELV